MMGWLAVPALLQASAMLLDELHFHRQRGLSRWERVGHPLDTLSVLACYGVALSVPPAPHSLALYVGLAVFSCLLVTKDEWVHTTRCKPAEQWLHAVLFVLHPIVLGIVALLWLQHERALLWLAASATAAFGSYQTLYWNLPWTRLLRSRSTTRSTTSSANAGIPPTTTPSRSYAPNPGSGTLG